MHRFRTLLALCAMLAMAASAQAITIPGPVNEVPEPGVLALVGIGLAALVLTRRKR